MVTPSKEAIEAELQQSFLTYEDALAAWYQANPYAAPPTPTTPEEYAAQTTVPPTGSIQTFPYTAATAPPPSPSPPPPLEEGYEYGIDAFIVPTGARFEKELPISVVHEPSGRVVEEYYGSQRPPRQKIGKEYSITFLDPITEAQLEAASVYGEPPAAWSYQNRELGASLGIFAQGAAQMIIMLPYEIIKLPKYAGEFVSHAFEFGYPLKAGAEFIAEMGKEFAMRPFYVGGQIAGATAVTATATKIGSQITKMRQVPVTEKVVDEITPQTYRRTKVKTRRGEVLSEFEYKFDVETIGDVTMKGKRIKLDVSLVTPEERAIYSADIKAVKPYDVDKAFIVSKRTVETGFLPDVEKVAQFDILKFEKQYPSAFDLDVMEPFKPTPPPKPSRIVYPKWDEPSVGGTKLATRTRARTAVLTQERTLPKTRVKTSAISLTKLKSEQKSIQKSLSKSKQLQFQDQRSIQAEVKQLTRTKQKSMVRQKQKQFVGVISKQEQKSMQAEMQKQIVDTKVVQEQISVQKIRALQIPISKTITRTETKPKPRIWPMRIDRRIPPLEPSIYRPRPRRKPKRITEYTPSVAAWAANITKRLTRAERKAKFTGFELRPIPTKKRKSKKKTKRRRKK